MSVLWGNGATQTRRQKPTVMVYPMAAVIGLIISIIYVFCR
jgi:hypothetical protein